MPTYMTTVCSSTMLPTTGAVRRKASLLKLQCSCLITTFLLEVFQHNLLMCIGVVGARGVIFQDGRSLVDGSTASDGTTHVADVPSVLALATLPSTITHIVSGGEVLTEAVITQVPPDAKLYNDYGPTEVTINSICNSAYSYRRNMCCRTCLPIRSFVVWVTTSHDRYYSVCLKLLKHLSLYDFR